MVSAIIAWTVNLIPGLKLRASEEAELLGMDDDQLGEFAYDYVEVRRDYLAWTPVKQEPGEAVNGVPMGRRHAIQAHCDMIEGKEKEEGEEEEGKEEEEEDSGRSRGRVGGGGGGDDEGDGLPTMGDRHGIAAENKLRKKTAQGGQ